MSTSFASLRPTHGILNNAVTPWFPRADALRLCVPAREGVGVEGAEYRQRLH